MKALMLTVFNLKKGLFHQISVLLLLFGFTFANVLSGQQDNGQFVVVLDAGHGGHDPGNLGNGYLEKNIALNIVLNAGALLERTPGIKVIYTRKDDTFIDLYVRGEIANKANADLFVSVHCDSHTSQAHGAGTFVLGLHANKQNFEIAKKENSVIYLEDNYESRYADYDINSPESVIGLTIMQEEFLDQSISLAKSIQHNFANKLKRKDRQVKQAGFIVLHQTFMPSVLVETGFLTNDDEGAYLNSKKGQTDMGASIAEAIINYKEGVQPNYSGLSNTTKMAMPNQNEIVVEKDKTPLDKKTVDEKTVDEKTLLNAKDAAEQFAKNPSANPIVEKKPERTSKEEGIGKSVQEMKDSSDEVTLNKVDVTKADLEKKSGKVLSEKEDPVKQELTSVNQAPKKAKVAKNEIPKTKVESASDAVKKEKKVASAPIKGNTKNITFKVQLMASTKKIALQSSNFKGLNKLSEERFKQFHRYMYGSTDSYSQAKLLKSNADAKGYPASYIVAYKDGVRIPTEDAIKLVSQ